MTGIDGATAIGANECRLAARACARHLTHVVRATRMVDAAREDALVVRDAHCRHTTIVTVVDDFGARRANVDDAQRTGARATEHSLVAHDEIGHQLGLTVGRQERWNRRRCSRVPCAYDIALDRQPEEQRTFTSHHNSTAIVERIFQSRSLFIVSRFLN